MQELRQHLVAAQPRGAKIALQNLDEIIEILYQHRLVQTQLGALGHQLLLGGVHAQNQLGGVAGRGA